MEKGEGMTILQLPSWYLPHGGQFVLHQTKALQEAGLTVRILANVVLPWTKYKGEMLNLKRFPCRPFFCEEDGVELLRHYSRPIPKSPILNIRYWAKQTLRLFGVYVRRYGLPDIVHVHSGTWGAYAASMIKKKYHVPYVVTEHRGVFGCKCQLARDFFRSEYTPFLREGYSNADYIIPVGDHLIPKISEFLIQDVPFRVVSNIVDTDFFVPEGSITKPHKPFRWISINGYYEVKGYDILLPAFDILCDKYSDVSLTIVGENFQSASFLELFARCRHKDRIHFTGELSREGVRSELQQADAFVMSSRVEAEPVSILEALAVGLPVAGTEVIPEYELPKQLGIRVPVEQPKLLAEAMCTLMENYGRYSAKAAHEHTVSIAHKNTVAQELISIYKQITK